MCESGAVYDRGGEEASKQVTEGRREEETKRNQTGQTTLFNGRAVRRAFSLVFSFVPAPPLFHYELF